MKDLQRLGCVVVGYNELPFERYVQLVAKYGRNSEAYRDLQFSFINLDGRPTNYVSLLNYVLEQAQPDADHPTCLRSGDIPNLAAAYLTNHLRARGVRSTYINLFQDEREEFARILKEEKPLCVAITTTFYVLNFPVNEIVEFVREHNSETRIVVGGPLISNHLRNRRNEELRSELLDIGADFYVVDAQGESTLLQLVRRLETGDDLASLPNLIYFRDGQLTRTPVAPEANSMDEADVRWDELAKEKNLGPTLQMRTARSCAFKCSFCNYPARAGRLSLASLDTIERELTSMQAIGNVQNVVFIDDTFNVPLPRFKEICRLLIRKQYKFDWFSYFRCSNSDEEAFDLMAESGCKGVFLGIESGSPTILKNMNKGATIERYAEGIRSLRQRGIATFGSFIVGFPGETSETVQETVDFVRTNKPDFYRAQMWYCEPGTPIDLEREKYRIRGQGFVWEHKTMCSLEAMDHIDRMFLTIPESIWLPQWSFDFWFIPYVLGKGISLEQFKQQVSHANSLLKLEIACCPENEKRELQRRYLQQMIASAIQRSTEPLIA